MIRRRKTRRLIMLYTVCLSYINMLDTSTGDAFLWNKWWNYEGISGPVFWGRLNSDWFMCTKGKNQSPIDIEPKLLLFDPSLKHIVINGDLVSGTLINYGFDLTFEVNETMEDNTVNLTLGPLSYQYRISQIKVHFGSKNGSGSEHTISGKHFDGEIHIVAYNSDVYSNLTQALKAPRGITIIAAFLQLRSIPNQEFYLISNLSQLVLYKGQRARLKNFSIKSLLPSTKHYMTYEGSLTQPGCQESVTWIILNKPLYVNSFQLEALRNLRQRDINHPQVFMFDNRRPVMPLHRRSIRTNINFMRWRILMRTELISYLYFGAASELRMKFTRVFPCTA